MLAARGAHLGTTRSSVADELFLAWDCAPSSSFYPLAGLTVRFGSVLLPPPPPPGKWFTWSRD